jgi:hypothetical protein
MAVTVPKQICVDEAAAKHVAHDISARLSQVPASASTSNLAQSREADDSSMFPLSCTPLPAELRPSVNRSRMPPLSAASGCETPSRSIGTMILVVLAAE